MDYENNVKRVIPMIMLVFISSATMISVINIISPQLTVDFGISPTTVSLLSMTVMLMMGVASVAYSTLSDYLSIRRLRDLRFRADDYPGEQVHRGAGACQILWVQYCLRVHFTGIRYPAGRFFCNVHRVEVCVPDSAGLTGSPSVHMQVCAG